MSLADIIAQVGGRSTIEQISKRFGLPEALTSQAVGMLLPSLTNGMSRNIQKKDGLGGLLAALANGNHANYLEQPERLSSAETAAEGNGILGHVLGGKDASRAVAATVSGFLGIDNQTVKQMLPVVATLAMGALAKKTSAAGISPEQAAGAGSSDVLGQLVGMLQSGGAAKILGGLFG